MSTSLCAAVASSRAVAGLAPCRRQALAAWLPQPRLATRANERSVTRSAAETAAAAASHQALAGRPAGRAKPQFDDAEFETMLHQLREWKEKHWGDTIVPRKVFDAQELGEWVYAMRQARRRGRLPQHAVAALDELGFAWDVDVVTAKWYHNLHAARHYKEVHGGELPPAEGCDSANPDWIEAGRWLERQRDLYRRQKLLLLRVRLMKELLGVKLEREYSRPRRNMHPVLKQGNAQFRALQRQRAQQGQTGPGGGRGAAAG